MRSLWVVLVTSFPLSLGAGAAAVPQEIPETLMPVLGEATRVVVEVDDTLLDLAYRHRLGFEAVSRVNPDVDPWIPEPGSIVSLPTRYVLPAAEPVGLVINLPEMRLYDFTVGEIPDVFAIAIGDAEDPTPIGIFRIGEKRLDPAWQVPPSILEEKPHLPPVVPPGPDNPLGGRWMTLGTSSYGIHGTNIRWSIGRMATHGCIRLYEDQMEELFDRTPSGTRVQIVYQPFKWGHLDDRLYLEAHPDVYAREPDRLAAALAVPRALGLLPALDLEQAWRSVEEARGHPVPVGRLPDRSEEDAYFDTPLRKMASALRAASSARRAACSARSAARRASASAASARRTACSEELSAAATRSSNALVRRSSPSTRRVRFSKSPRDAQPSSAAASATAPSCRHRDPMMRSLPNRMEKHVACQRPEGRAGPAAETDRLSEPTWRGNPSRPRAGSSPATAGLPPVEEGPRRPAY